MTLLVAKDNGKISNSDYQKIIDYSDEQTFCRISAFIIGYNLKLTLH